MNRDLNKFVSFFAELKRREVFSSAAYYFAIAWGTIEILEWVLERWQIMPPEWVMPLLATALVVGFPVTMFLAWMFDFDKTGIRRTPPAGKRGQVTVLLATLLMVGGTGGLYYLIGSPETPQRWLPPTVQPKFAILPFENFGGSTGTADFADGIHYELIRNLGQIQSMRFISRQSVMQYRNSSKTLLQIAAELGVDALLTGAVQRMGDRVRISMSLREGQHDSQLWEDDFEFTFTPDNFFEVQTEIAATVAKAFEMSLSDIDRERISEAPTHSLSAYDVYLQGLIRMTSETVKDAETAEKLFQEAIRIDPEYALAYVGLFNAYRIQSRKGSLPISEANEMMESLALKALELDDQLVEAWINLGTIRWRQAGNSTQEVEAAYQRALELNPNHAGALSVYAYFVYVIYKDYETVLNLYQRAQELNPRSSMVYARSAQVMEDMFKPEKALEFASKALQITPGHAHAHMVLAWVYMNSLNDFVEGWRHLLTVAENDPVNSYITVQLTLAALTLNDLDAAQRWAAETWRRGPNKNLSCQAMALIELYKGNLVPSGDCFEHLKASWSWQQFFRDQYLANNQPELARSYYEQNYPDMFERGRPLTFRHYRFAIDLYPVLTRTGEQEFADELLQQALEIVKGHHRLSTGGFGWADVEIYALRGETQRALAAMRAAIDEGMRWEWWTLPTALNLQSLWDEPEFRIMLAEIENDMTIQRKAVHDTFGGPGQSPSIN